MSEHFKKAIALLDKIEGGFSNHPVDHGGMTYRGISRVYYPDWPGWKLVDSVDIDSDVREAQLNALVEDFYLREYWRRFQGDAVAELSLDIAFKVFESGVNLDIYQAVRYLQESLNLLNRNQRIYKDILVDGKLGPKTLETLHRALSSRPPAKDVTERRIIKIISVKQCSFYIRQMEMHPDREEFRGWFDRC